MVNPDCGKINFSTELIGDPSPQQNHVEDAVGSSWRVGQQQGQVFMEQ